MSKHKKDSLLEALKEGRSYTWTVPDGGNLASMREAIKHGQTLTMSPVAGPSEIQVGDKVLVKWHNSTIFHIVAEIQGDRFLIVNSLGKINGWVGGGDILGRVTNVVEPEPRPTVPAMLAQLDAAFHHLIETENPAEEDAQRLLSIVSDLRWYSGRIGAERWNVMPRSNKWSFEQNLVWLIKKAQAVDSAEQNHVEYLTDQGKMCVGLASEICELFQDHEAE